MKFIHSLVSAYIIDTSNQEPEVIEGRKYRKLEIKISEFFKRLFYIPCCEDPQKFVVEAPAGENRDQQQQPPQAGENENM
jgi:hypothetical protein